MFIAYVEVQAQEAENKLIACTQHKGLIDHHALNLL